MTTDNQQLVDIARTLQYPLTQQHKSTESCHNDAIHSDDDISAQSGLELYPG